MSGKMELIDRLRVSAMTHYREQRELPSFPSEAELVDGKWCPGSFEGTVPLEEIQVGSGIRSRCVRCPWESAARVGNRPMRHRPKRRD